MSPRQRETERYCVFCGLFLHPFSIILVCVHCAAICVSCAAKSAKMFRDTRYISSLLPRRSLARMHVLPCQDWPGMKKVTFVLLTVCSVILYLVYFYLRRLDVLRGSSFCFVVVLVVEITLRILPFSLLSNFTALLQQPV
jgi:hypothetical protein